MARVFLASCALFVAWSTMPSAASTEMPIEPPMESSSTTARPKSAILPVPEIVVGPIRADLRPSSPDQASARDLPPALPSDTARGDVLHAFEGRSWIGTNDIAVGADHVVLAHASELWTFTRGGDARAGSTLRAFFRGVLPASWNGVFHGAEVHYSREHDRYALATSTWDFERQESCGLIAISRTTNPLDGWYTYRFAAGGTDHFGPASLTVDTWGVYFTADVFSSTNDFLGARLLSLDTTLLDGTTTTAWQFDRLDWPDGALAQHVRGALPHSVSSEQTTFFFNTRAAGGSDVLVWRLSGHRTDLPVLVRDAIPVSTYRPLIGGARQPSGAPIATGGTASYHVVYVYRRLYAVWTSDPTASGFQSRIISLKIDTDSRSVVTEHTIGGQDSWYYFNPSLIVNGRGGPLLDTAVVYNFTHEFLEHPSAAVEVFATDGTRTNTVLHVGNASVPANGLTAPWPAWGGASYDWFDPGRAWASFTIAPDGHHRSRVVSFALDDQPSPGTGGGGGGGGGTGPCVQTSQTACLDNGRFQVEVEWQDPDGPTRAATRRAISGSDTSTLFWFFDPTNIEMLTKVLDGCALNDHFWVFSAATTNLGYTLTVVDTETGRRASYTNAPGAPAPAVTDALALPCS
ncbi:MAG: hypothetical protein AAGE94_13380 [Acidobacteriota bacterium]